MISINEQAFETKCDYIEERLRHSRTVETKRWQSTDLNPNALRMKEICHEQIELKVPDTLDELRSIVKPFLPWADNHFEQERISGQPINPGETYKEWRYPASAAQHTDFQFSHSYAERYWPTYAGKTPGGRITTEDHPLGEPNTGIRHSYGDLMDLVYLLIDDPFTRQAYLPIFFPEDLKAARKKERIPCTLGYHFIQRDGYLDVVYPMRSCDFVRHFRDDVYLTARLLLWVRRMAEKIAKARHNEEAKKFWSEVKPGILRMYISSLHCFESDLD